MKSQIVHTHTHAHAHTTSITAPYIYIYTHIIEIDSNFLAANNQSKIWSIYIN